MALGLVISVMVCNLGSSVALTTGARLTTLGLPNLDLAFLAHHKTGTALSCQIALDLAHVLGMPAGVQMHQPKSPTECRHNEIVVYSKCRYQQTLNTIKACPSIRAVHIVRRPTSAFVSDYVYEKNLAPSEVDYQQLPHKFRHDLLQVLNVSAGVQANCQWWSTSWPTVGGEIADMVEVHQYIQFHKPPNVLEVRLEDFGSNYDKTARSIFEHFLGKNDSRINELMKLSQEHDLGRHPSLNHNHVSDTREKADVLMEVQRQYLAGDPCMKEIVKSDSLLGYASQTETS